MRCPYCKQDHDKVIDTRPSEDGHVTRRRRECLACGRRYTTHERLEEIPLKVIKKNSTRVPFDRARILSGIAKALEKRPVHPDQAESIADEIEREILEQHEREVTSTVIGEMVMEKLRRLDKVAYVRFASVYRDFKTVEEFRKEIDTIDTDSHESNGETRPEQREATKGE